MGLFVKEKSCSFAEKISFFWKNPLNRRTNCAKSTSGSDRGLTAQCCILSLPVSATAVMGLVTIFEDSEQEKRHPEKTFPGADKILKNLLTFSATVL